MVINKKICPKGLKNNPNKALKSLDFITIHNTGNYSATAKAKNHADYQYAGSGGSQISWHYTVDKNEVWQSFEDTQSCWHAGNSTGNSTSLGIEICVNDKSGFKAACENAAWLTAKLLMKYNLPIEKVVQHNKWSGKNCPMELRSGEWGVKWNDFITMVKRHFTTNDNDIPVIGSAAAIKIEATPSEPTPEQIITTLAGKVKIASPEYWVKVLSGKETANIEYLNTLFARLAGFDV